MRKLRLFGRQQSKRWIMPRDANGHKRGRNDPCWCGSGRKFKNCHLSRSTEEPTARHEALNGALSSFKFEECSCPADWRHECSGNIVRAHSLSRRNALATVTEAGHVFSLTPDMKQLFNHDRIEFKNKSAKAASTFTGFCGYHDNRIFLKLDNNEFDGGVEMTFLSACRTLCRELFVKRGQLRSAEFGRGMDRGRGVNAQIQIQQIASDLFDGANVALDELEELRRLFEPALKGGDYSEFAFANYHFNVQPHLVSAGGFNPSHDTSAAFLQSLDLATRTENVFFSILPDGDGFWASFMWRRSHTLVRRFVDDVEENFCSPGGAYGVALSHIENTFMRPSFWESLPEATKADFSFLHSMDIWHQDYRGAKNVVARLSLQYPGEADRILKQ